MQNRKRNVSCLPRSLPRKRGASLGERSAIVAPKRARSDLDSAKLVLVEWLDALAQGEWHEAKREDLRCKSIGFVVYEDDDMIVVTPRTYEASCQFGAGTKWCTTSSPTYFNNYSTEGKLFYFIDKKKMSSTSNRCRVHLCEPNKIHRVCFN